MVDDGDRTRHFPGIVARHGGPIERWIELLSAIGDDSYQRQFDFLREEHGFSKAHANALVMYARGSVSPRRFRTVDDWFAATKQPARATVQRIFATVRAKRPELDLVIAWNHPMLRTQQNQYVLGVSVSTRHILINPFSGALIDAFAQRLAGYTCNKKTFAVPLDWTVDAALLHDLTSARLAELSGST